MHLMIASGPIICGPEYWDEESFCIVQSILLNYIFIVIQAQMSFMMLNNCCVALRWKLFGDLEKRVDRISILLVLSFGLPLVPTTLIALNALGSEGSLDINQTNSVIIQPSPFFSIISGHKIFWITTLWHLLFVAIGCTSAIYLLYRAIKSRRALLAAGPSQMTINNILRLTMATLIYICLTVGSVTLLLQTKLRIPPNSIPMDLEMHLRSPWTNPDLCYDEPLEDANKYFYWTRCPTLKSFFPIIVGIGLFFMYGFGSPARLVYHGLRIKTREYFKPKKRKNSTIPSLYIKDDDDDLTSSSDFIDYNSKS